MPGKTNTTSGKRAQVMARAQAAAARITTKSYDPKTREFEAVLSGGAAVVKVPWFDEPFLEELDMSPGAVRMQRMQSGQAPILDNHAGRVGGARWASVQVEQVGVVRSSELANGKLVYRGQLSARDSIEGLRRDVEDGVVANQSAGYVVHAYRDVTKPEDKMRRLLAIDWEPFEASFAVVPAEVEQGVRGEWGAIESRELAGARASELEHVCVIEGRIAPEGTKMDPEVELQNQGQGGTRTAVLPPPQPAPTPTPAPDAGRAQAEADRVRKEERERVEGIRGLSTRHKLGDEFAKGHVDGGTSMTSFREAAFAELEKRQGAQKISSHPATPKGGRDESETLGRGVAEYMEHRCNLVPLDKLSDNGKRFRGLTLVELGRDLLQAHGVNTRGLTKDQVFNQLLSGAQARAFHGTGDFAEITSAVASKAMRKAYDAQPQRWLSLSRPNSAPDFKAMKRIQLSQMGPLQQVAEHGEIRRTTLSDTSESYSLKTYANLIGFTRQLFINDDLNALSRIARMFGSAAAEMQNTVMWGLITSNPVMADGVALFNATHNNLVNAGGGAGVLNETGLKNMRIKLRNQKDFKGNTVQVEPRKLIVPTTLEVDARKYTAVITAASAANVNVFGGAFDEVIVDAHLDAADTAAWYVAGSPDQYDLLEHSTLEGATGPQISERVGFETDGFDMRVIHDFAGAVLEFVSIAKSTGS